MLNASIIVDRDFVVGSISARMYGSFVEHLGRAVYGGIYEPGHPTADPQGFRQDVLALVRELGVTVIRYPGGNLVSGYRWEDGVGPKENRPRRRELAWMSTESNRFGADDFIDWCRCAKVEPMLAANLGTRGPVEAGELFEYCNHPRGTALSDLRRSNGHEEPHAVRLWCLGNEMDGPWQMGAMPAAKYGRKAREAVKMMTGPDAARGRSDLPFKQFVVCGSSARTMSTFGHWDQDVLEECFDKVDYLSVHSYVSPKNLDVPSFLAFADLTMGKLIEEVTAICDAVAAKRRSTKRVHLSYDEWNVWYFNSDPPFEAFAEAPCLLENVYTLADALCVGTMLITLLNHCDRVKIACLAQLVNVIGPIMTRTGGPAWRQTTFYPFSQAARFARGSVLRQVADIPTYKVGGEPVGLLTSTIIRNDDGGVTILAVNRDLDNPINLALELRSFGAMRLVDWSILDGDLMATNTQAHPDRVQPWKHCPDIHEGSRLDLVLPKASWNVMRLQPT